MVHGPSLAADFGLKLVGDCFEVLLEQLADVLFRGDFALLLDDAFCAQLQQFTRDYEGWGAGLVHTFDQTGKRIAYDWGHLFGR
jgi:hypothetical protein